MRSWVLAVVLSGAALGACSGGGDDAEGPQASSPSDPPLSMEEFCPRYDEVGELQQSGDGATAAMELARLSLVAPDEVSEPMEQLYELLEDRLAGREIDFDAMLDASLEIDEACGEGTG